MTIRTDMYPARVSVTSSDGATQLFDQARLVITADAIYVFKDSPAGPTLVFNERMDSYDRGVPLYQRTRTRPAREASAVTDSGSQVTFTRASGCGCGSRLKYFDPFTAVPAAASTRDR